MNPEKRVVLNSHEEVFVQLVTNIDSLIQSLIDKKVFSESHRSYIEKAGSITDLKRELIRTIPKRGPLAYSCFLSSLRDTGNEALVEKLETCREPHFGVKRSVYKMDYDLEKCYRMRSQPKGLVLIVNFFNFKNSKQYEPRLGSDLDLVNLEKLWTDLGYKVICKSDLCAKDLINCVKDFSRSKELYIVDSCVVFIMSHGKSEQSKQGVSIVCSDDQLVHSQTLTAYFNVSNCPALARKPKLFFFQACRGDMKEYGIGIENDFRHLSLRSLTDESCNDVDYQRSKSAPACNEPSHNNNISVVNLDFETEDLNSDIYEDQLTSNEISSGDKQIRNDIADNISNGIEKMLNESNDIINNNGHNDFDKTIDETSDSDLLSENVQVNGVKDAESINEVENGENGFVVPDSTKFRGEDQSNQNNQNNQNNQTDSELNSSQIAKLGNYTDMLIVYPSHPGFCSLRDEDKGSWLVQEICNVFVEKACNHDLIDMLNLVMRNLEKRHSRYGFQLTHYENLHFNKKLFFNPGLYH